MADQTNDGLAQRVQIYALTDPGTGEVRYVGKSVDAASRLQQHIWNSTRKHKHLPVACWIRSLSKKGLCPSLLILEECLESDWPVVESRLIALHRGSGRLLNVADGGEQPVCPPHVRAENGRKAARSRDKRMWKLKRDLGQALRAGHVSEATKTRMRERMDVFGQFAEYL